MPTAKVLRLLGVILSAVLFLSGCTRYDVGIRFADANHGEITQHIYLDENIPGLGGTVINSWLETLEQQTIQLNGRVRHLSPQEIFVQVPFYNAKDLQTKFNQLFSAQTRSTQKKSPVGSHLQITTGNWIVWQRSHLQYDLDLRGLDLPILSDTENSEPLELEFSLNTPWGAKAIELNSTDANSTTAASGASNPIAATYTPRPRNRGRQLIWRLKPGSINHVEAIFWVPSPLGIGAVLIVLLVLGGSYLKTRSDRSVGT